MNDIQGWINLYKPKNISSFKAINRIKNKFKFNKIGHGGTLDPMAEGILPIALGKTTKLISFINNNYKTYKFTVQWGAQTTTDDSEGEFLYYSDTIPNKNSIILNLKNFLGEIIQTPPKVSAVKVQGERAYNLSRKNIDFKIKPKKVFVKNLKMLDHRSNKTSFFIECGKGFYVRSFARDFAKTLGTYGHISSLERIKVGKFTKKSSILLDDLLKIGERLSEFNCIKPSISMLDDILAIEIDNKIDLKNLSHGKSIKIDEAKSKISLSSKLDNKKVLLFNGGDVVSVGKLTGNLFKPNKVLI